MEIPEGLVIKLFKELKEQVPASRLVASDQVVISLEAVDELYDVIEKQIEDLRAHRQAEIAKMQKLMEEFRKQQHTKNSWLDDLMKQAGSAARIKDIVEAEKTSAKSFIPKSKYPFKK